MSVGSTTSTKLGAIDMVAPVNCLSPLNRGLVAWWLCVPGLTGGSRLCNLTRLGDKDGGHGTLTNGPTWGGALGRPGGSGALRFTSASSQRVTFTAIPLTALTYAAWVRFASNTGGNVSILANKKTILIFNFATMALRWFPDEDGASVDYSWTPTLSRWYHVAVTQSGTDYAIYIDGLSVQAGTAEAIDASAGGNGDIGSWSNFGETWFFDGHLDDVLIANRAQSASELWQHYEGSSLGYPTTPNRLRPYTVFDVADEESSSSSSSTSSLSTLSSSSTSTLSSLSSSSTSTLSSASSLSSSSTSSASSLSSQSAADESSSSTSTQSSVSSPSSSSTSTASSLSSSSTSTLSSQSTLSSSSTSTVSSLSSSSTSTLSSQSSSSTSTLSSESSLSSLSSSSTSSLSTLSSSSTSTQSSSSTSSLSSSSTSTLSSSSTSSAVGLFPASAGVSKIGMHSVGVVKLGPVSVGAKRKSAS